jgi:hypothetical protein
MNYNWISLAMLIELVKYPAKELPWILTSKATAAKLQKSRERGTEKEELTEAWPATMERRR